eukprot:4780102-Ditylum_brightwellii.AAC.1
MDDEVHRSEITETDLILSWFYDKTNSLMAAGEQSTNLISFRRKFGVFLHRFKQGQFYHLYARNRQWGNVLLASLLRGSNHFIMNYMGCNISLATFVTTPKEQKELWTAHKTQINKRELDKCGTVHGLWEDFSFEQISKIASFDIVKVVSYRRNPMEETA